MDTPVQVQQPSAETTTQVPPTAGNAPGEGIQRRIDELVAQGKTFQEQLQREREQNQVLIATLTEMSTKQMERPAVAEPAVQVEPDEAAKIRAVVNPILEEVRSMTRTMMARVGQQEFQTAAQNPAFADQRVKQRATELMGQWQTRRLSGWTPEDALKYALGEVAAAESIKAAQSRASQTQFNSQTQVVQGANGVPQIVSSEQVPQDINTWDLNKQIEFWEKRSADKAF